ncbi:MULTISPECIES: acetate/propionate family kinase [Protofrankia]|uniref:Acetate kinase n=1 Tax=Candidatus Protofrankia datiscae TaxID=2716812 RepID=F8AVL4_9ACTN|nr:MULTISPECIES: acetate/propionate family kinase [Protofrankia]AEH10904.1 Acetate kinase [Candidatus Protofrankia datiscae]
MNILVVNAGSSSLKLRLLEPGDALLAAVDLRAREGRPNPDEVTAAITDLARLGELGAVGHRIVHGGTEFTDPVVVTDRVVKELRSLAVLAPLHQPAALAALAEVRTAAPGITQVACFDTSFHARIPLAAATYAVPADWRDRLGVRRYGFHGLSHAYASRRAAALTGGRRVVTCHLGSGASLAAVRDGVSIDTTMGFTPLEGLVMATRSGTIDPGLLLWLQTSAGLSADELTETLFHRSGLAALAGTPDMRTVVNRAVTGEAASSLALAVYLHRLRAQIAAMAAALGGLDTLVFTGRVGERSATVRAGATDGLGFLGVGIDPARNVAHADGDHDITAAGSPARTLVVEAREDLEIARSVRVCLAGQFPR